jgi:regulator of replication initiation timing
MPDDVSLKEYIDSRINSLQANIGDLRSYIEQHFELNDKALMLANESMLVRLESMNEFREQIKEERANLATKEHLTALQKEFNSRIQPLEEAKAFSAGKMWMVMAIFAGIPTILALIALFT